MKCGLATLCLLLICGRAWTLPGDAEVETIVAPYIEDRWCMGVVVGVIDESGTRIWGFGRMSERDGRVPDGETVFEIASVTKVFTGLLLSQMVLNKEMALDDPLQKYLPETVRVPKEGEAQITLLLLATHRSGLPRMPGNFRPKDWGNPFVDYTQEAMYEFLSSHKLRRRPGETYEYSNLGFALLGHAMERRAGVGFERLVVDRICRPLEMKDTCITLSESMKKRLAPGHDADGRPVKSWDLPTFGGGGALRSTTADMLKFLAAQMGLAKTDLADAISATHERRASAAGTDSIALGWHIRAPTNAVWHNGQTGGYHSCVSFSPEKRVGVVVLTNTATMYADQIAGDVLRTMMGLPVGPLRLKKLAQVDGKVLDEYVGRYSLRTDTVVTITREGDHLVTQTGTQAKVNIYPESETTFFARQAHSAATFERDEKGKVSRMVVEQDGRKMTASRVEER